MNNYKTFTSSDFIDLDNYKNVNKTLERLEDEKIIRRIRRGIYYLPQYNEVLGLDEAPDVNEIALAIARQFNIVIIPSGNYALILLVYQTRFLQNTFILLMDHIMNIELETIQYISNILLQRR